MGTPHGKRGFFHNEWRSNPAFRKFKVTAAECPRISAEYLKAERAALSDRWYAQEFECEWQESEAALFRSDIIERAVRDHAELEIDLGLGCSEYAAPVHYTDRDVLDIDLE
ncbi:MAG TPA: hypothetical protein VEB88_01740 [Candidatus Acidoferrales bacterium]|nr:hypothetical protein [Candidatus Acidoferrales bacterium]